MIATICKESTLLSRASIWILIRWVSLCRSSSLCACAGIPSDFWISVWHLLTDLHEWNKEVSA
jgi:hypothetical protein